MSKPDDGIPRRNGLRVASAKRWESIKGGLGPKRVKANAGERKPMRACRKIPHQTKAGAARHIASLRALPDARDADNLHFYFCSRCRAYHVGHAVDGKKRKPPKRLKTRRQALSDEARALKAAGCEITRLLDWVSPPGWRGHWSAWSGHPDAGVVDIHHLFGRQHGEPAWNVVAASRVAHEFVQSTRVGRVICVWALCRRGDFDRAAIREAHGRDPLGLISNDLENGIFSGRLARVASALCKRGGE